MDDFLKKIRDFCLQYDMLPEGARVIACVSGGTDSMCMLEVLRALAPEMGFGLRAAHFNHMLRGAESDGDEAFVREYCGRIGVPLDIGSGDVAGEAAKSGRGLEETARDMRYAFFHSLSPGPGAARIATAHNSDDNLETVLLRIARGTGLRGLCGIPPVRGDIIRPLLAVSRAEIQAYCEARGIPHREDSSNLSDGYARNRLRHHVVPVLREINPAVDVTAMTRLLRRDGEYLDGLARELVDRELSGGRIAAKALLEAPVPVASRAVRMICGRGLTAEQVDRVLALCGSPDPSAELSLPGLTVRREYGWLVTGPSGKATFSPFRLPLDRPVIIEGTDISVSCEVGEDFDLIYNSLTTFFVSYDKIKENITVRPRMTGDSIKLPGRGTRTVKKLLIDRRVPAGMRDALPVVVCGGELVGVCGLGQDVRTFPQKGGRYLKINIEGIKI